MPYIKIKDLNIFYEDLGTGEPIVFLHSHFSRGILAFGAQIQPFQNEYRCLFPDLRGHGRTLCDSLLWDSRIIAEDIALFLDKLDIQKAHIVAYSFGTTVGMYFAAHHPDKVISFTAIGAGTQPVVDEADDYLPENLLKKNKLKFIEDMTIRHKDAHKGDWKTFINQTVQDWKNHPNLTEAEWKLLKCPIFFINGEHDPFGNCYELQKKCSHARVYEVKDGGHRPHFINEQGKEVNSLILDFINSNKKA